MLATIPWRFSIDFMRNRDFRAPAQESSAPTADSGHTAAKSTGIVGSFLERVRRVVLPIEALSMLLRGVHAGALIPDLPAARTGNFAIPANPSGSTRRQPHGAKIPHSLPVRTDCCSAAPYVPTDGIDEVSATAGLDAATANFPMILKVSGSGIVQLRPAPGAGGLGRVLAELLLLSQTGRLDRLRMCASDECKWMFFDRSKPGNRRWCSSALCGNRQKTRAYRERQHEDAHPVHGHRRSAAVDRG
jgi:CGNR zinc finger